MKQKNDLLSSNCSVCKGIFYYRISNRKNPLFCSHACRGVSQRGEVRKKRYSHLLPDQLNALLKNRYDAKVIKKEGCWDWKGAKDKRGYGRIRFNNKKILAHRISYMIHCGDLTDNDLVLHHCDNPSCSYPLHLYKGSHANNAQDRERRNRINHSKGEGHYLSKLTQEIVRQIREIQEKETIVSIANRFSVDKSTIYDVIRRKTWKHI